MLWVFEIHSTPVIYKKGVGLIFAKMPKGGILFPPGGGVGGGGEGA